MTRFRSATLGYDVDLQVVDKARALGQVADAHGVPLPAAALQFPLGHPIVTSVIPGPRDAGELAQILEWFKTPIPEAFWSDLKAQGLLAESAPTPSG